MSDITVSEPPTTAAEDRGRKRRTLRALLGTGTGNALEWFDWNIYAIFATYFAAQFFNGEDKLSALLSTLAVFAVGFVARPFGGFLFGWISDRRGRKFSMSLSIALAALGSLVIGLSPTYAAIGTGASLILLFARLVQGLAHGGELPSAQTYIAEYAPRERRGRWSSLIYVSGTMGVLFGTFLAAVLSAVLTADQMAAFGWRIPFVLGGLFGLYALFMRLRMTETKVFLDDVGDRPAVARPRIWPSIVAHKRQALQVIGMTVGLTIVYYAWAISAPAHAIATRGIEPTAAFWAGVVANVIFIAVLPVWGILSDRIGRKPVLLTGALGTAVLVFPLNGIIGDSAVMLAVAMTIAMIFIAMGAAIVPAIYAEMFPTHIRTIGVGIPYSIAVAAFGGTAPYLQQLLGTTLGPAWFTIYVIVMLLISAAVIVRLPETRGKELHETDKPSRSESLSAVG
jgi:MHS family alpha-ketoglutarate permease-like MFS transporter